MRQTTRGTDDYTWARRMMTEETNAAIAGAADAGALKIVVSDAHGDMGNILPMELDPRAELVQGTPKLPWSMMTGIEEGFTGCVFLGITRARAPRPRSSITPTPDGSPTSA